MWRRCPPESTAGSLSRDAERRGYGAYHMLRAKLEGEAKLYRPSWLYRGLGVDSLSSSHSIASITARGGRDTRAAPGTPGSERNSSARAKSDRRREGDWDVEVPAASCSRARRGASPAVRSRKCCCRGARRSRGRSCSWPGYSGSDPLCDPLQEPRSAEPCPAREIDALTPFFRLSPQGAVHWRFARKSGGTARIRTGV
jgi:hypothetical protein